MIEPLWSPSKQKISTSNMDILRRKLNQKFNLNLTNYLELHNWSINNLGIFWEYVWYDTKIKYSKNFNTIVDNENKMPGAKWFSESKLNFAQNLLRVKSDKIAIEFYSEDIVHMVHEAVAQYFNAEKFLNTKTTLGDKIREEEKESLRRGGTGKFSFDHRTIQNAHDVIAGNYRYRTPYFPLFPDFPDKFDKDDEKWKWLQHLVKEIL